MTIRKQILQKNRCLIIGEIAQAHDGSLGTAHAYIDAIAQAGADAVKFQTHIAAAESTPAEPFRVKFSKQDETRYAYWKRMEFTEHQWQGLAQHASEKGLIFLSSPFSLEAVDLLKKLEMPAWKIASGELTNQQMLDRILATKRPVLLSSGMSSISELDQIVAHLKDAQADFAVMQCTTAYPCPPEKIGLNLMPYFRERYGCAVGLSDHSGTIYPGLAAATLQADVLEVHVTFSREMFGPDVPASLTTSELKQLVDGVRFIEKMRANPVDKDVIAQEMQPLRQLFTKSIVLNQDLQAGTKLQKTHLGFKKPGTGLPANRLEQVIGKTLQRDMQKDELISENDLKEGL